MLHAFDVRLPEGKALFQMIGWFSLCMIVAGWGPAIDPAIRSAWAYAGVVGISAALIFDGNYRRGNSPNFNQPQANNAGMNQSV